MMFHSFPHLIFGMNVMLIGMNIMLCAMIFPTFNFNGKQKNCATFQG